MDYRDGEIRQLAAIYPLLSPQKRDTIAEELSMQFYLCVECDETCRQDYTECLLYPTEHDETGYIGTGTDYDEDTRRLVRLIAND